MRLARFSLFTLCLLVVSTVFANSNPFSSSSSSVSSVLTKHTTSTDFLTVDQAYQLSPAIVEPKSIHLEWQIADHYYLYKHAFKVLLDGRDISSTTLIPDGKVKHDELFGKVEVYYHSINIVAQDITPGPHTLSVSYQGCADAGLCFPPETVNYKLDMSTTTLTPVDKPAIKPLSNQAVTPPELNAKEGHTSLFSIILFALAGGLILNLMPCVLPVLSLKALAINNQNIAKTRLQSWYYTVGVIVSFVAIATLLITLRSAGEAIGWGFQLQSPWFVATLAYLFLILGLAMSGYTELGSSLMGAGQSLTQGNSNRSAFFTGVLATVIASPCTAPFMGAATGYALGQSPAIIFIVFAALGLGMALPLLLISYVPALHNLLPKPGNWMVRFKEFLAFPLYATALWLLWVIGRQVGIDGAMMVLGGGILIAFALWLWRGSKLSKLFAIAALAISIALLASNSLKPSSNITATVSKDNYQPYSNTLLNQLLKQDNAVFVDFTADWCITCLANEKTTLSSNEIQQLFKGHNVKLLRADWTNYNPEITAALGKHGRSGVPLYLYYPAGSSSPVILPQILTRNIIRNAIMDSP